MRILVVEDEADLARTIAKALGEEGYAVDVAGDGVEGLFKATTAPYDAIVLDLLLPRLDGLAMLSTLRSRGVRTSVLILTARDSIEQKVQGLNTGADDYLTKPFALSELLARLHALIRRASVDPVTEVSAGPVVIDTAARIVRRAGVTVDLTAREYAIVELLARRKGTVVSRSAIYDHVYDERGDTTSNVIDVYVAALRRKLGRDVIRTRRGHGYVIDA